MEEKNEEWSVKDHTNIFVERLNRASNELDTLKTSFSKGMEELARVQNLLSLEGVDSISTMMKQFEDRISEAEIKRREAADGARRFSAELEKEKERLIKLWEAYKNQEEELATAEKRAQEFEEKARTIEQSKKQLEMDLTGRITTLTRKLEEREQASQQFEETRQRLMRTENIKSELETTIQNLRRDMAGKDERIHSLEAQVAQLRPLEQLTEFKKKFQDVSVEFEKEKDRLTKLFHLYEETEAENRTLKNEVKEWQDWFASNEEIFSKLFSSIDHLRKNVPSEQQPMNETEECAPDSKQKPGHDEGKHKRKLPWRH